MPYRSPFTFGFLISFAVRKYFPFSSSYSRRSQCAGGPEPGSRGPSLVDSPRLDTSQYHSFMARSSTTDNIDSDGAEVSLSKCSKAVYWTLVQYSQGHRSRGSRVVCRGKSPSSLNTQHLTPVTRHSFVKASSEIISLSPSSLRLSQEHNSKSKNSDQDQYD